MNLTIRRAKETDIKQLTNLLNQLFSIEEDYIFDEKKHEKGLKLLIKSENNIVLVAQYNSKVIGMLTAQTTISTVEGTITALLEDMIVDKDHRNKGIGKLLMKNIETWANQKNITRLQLLADKTNNRALEFYTKLGWQKTKMECWRSYIKK